LLTEANTTHITCSSSTSATFSRTATTADRLLTSDSFKEAGHISFYHLTFVSESSASLSAFKAVAVITLSYSLGGAASNTQVSRARAQDRIVRNARRAAAATLFKAVLVTSVLPLGPDLDKYSLRQDIPERWLVAANFVGGREQAHLAFLLLLF
jgi:hypothetical protein